VTLRSLLFSQTPAGSPVATPIVVQFGTSTANPVAIGEPVMAGPLELTVHEAVSGGEGTEMVMDAWEWNLAPADGYGYVAAQISITNGGDRAIIVDNDDFGFVTSSRRIWARQGLVAPEPALRATLEPGDSAEGWVAGQIEDGDDSILLVFSNRDLGPWSERFVALSPGASLSSRAADPVSANAVGRQVDTPAKPGESVVTADWSLTITDVRFAEDVVALFPEEDYRTTALASADPSVIPSWIAFQLDVRHGGAVSTPLHWPVDAIGLAYADGSAVEDVRILSAPLPELSGWYLPGGRGEGWYLIELPYQSTGNVLRFQPFRSDADTRYLTWSDDASTAVPEPLPDSSGA
jgi:hypothetical protein